MNRCRTNTRQLASEQQPAVEGSEKEKNRDGLETPEECLFDDSTAAVMDHSSDDEKSKHKANSKKMEDAEKEREAEEDAVAFATPQQNPHVSNSIPNAQAISAASTSAVNGSSQQNSQISGTETNAPVSSAADDLATHVPPPSIPEISNFGPSIQRISAVAASINQQITPSNTENSSCGSDAQHHSAVPLDDAEIVSNRTDPPWWTSPSMACVWRYAYGCFSVLRSPLTLRSHQAIYPLHRATKLRVNAGRFHHGIRIPLRTTSSRSKSEQNSPQNANQGLNHNLERNMNQSRDQRLIRSLPLDSDEDWHFDSDQDSYSDPDSDHLPETWRLNHRPRRRSRQKRGLGMLIGVENEREDFLSQMERRHQEKRRSQRLRKDREVGNI